MVEKIAKFLLVFLILILSETFYAQKDVTHFLGIPVDGYKPEMKKKLQNKGYTISPSDKDVLVGEFNGTDVNIHIVTNNNKVYRIMVRDKIGRSEGDIKIRFNNLCHQFQNSEKYIPAALSPSDNIIPEEEDISYEMSVKNKRYEAVFYQLPTNLDTVNLRKEIETAILSKYTEDELHNPTAEMPEEVIKFMLSYLLERYSNKVVWFMISEHFGKYYISMFYDNEYNRANGEDL